MKIKLQNGKLEYIFSAMLGSVKRRAAVTRI
ncbi:hypothetical protein M495_14435 [Serratia liquefaciens ATCC 27592]|nr:hypothetical protein M495_14435 [Serratia liquefaciens ATCC 27592]